jgi:hypothetical protein
MPTPSFENLREKFPDARFHPEYRLVMWRPTGILTNDAADQMVDFLESAEKVERKPFDRFTDMTGYTRIQLGLDHIVRIARRRKTYKGEPVRSAFYAVRLLSLSIAHMYEELMVGSKIQVCTFRDRNAAAEWLGVPKSLLQSEEKLS